MRIEDLDPPRESPGSADQIIAALDAFGFQWNESILRQSTRIDAYQAAVADLLSRDLAFPCSCSRSELQAALPRSGSDDELRYPGWCREGVRSPHRPLAIRFRVPDADLAIIDEFQGMQTCNLAADIGDFVIRRRDGLHAYQLAVVMDDAEQRITHVVRGADLLSSTPRQVALQRALALPTPMYAHLPVVTDANGIKLSKSTGAAAINTDKPTADLWRALRFLKQAPPYELRSAAVAELWEWAIEHWRAQPLPGRSYAARVEPPA